MTSAVTIRNSNATEPNAPPLEFFGNRLNGSTAARLGKLGFVVEPDQPFEADNGYAANFCVWSQIGANPYYRTNPDLEVKYNGDVVINNGQLQTNTITSKDAAAGDASIELGANAKISTGGAERVKVDPNGRFLVGQNAGANPNFDAHFHKNGWNQLVVESVSNYAN